MGGGLLPWTASPPPDAQCIPSLMPFWYGRGWLPNMVSVPQYGRLGRLCLSLDNGGHSAGNLGGRCDHELTDPAKFFLDQRQASVLLFPDARLRAWCMAFCWCKDQERPSGIPDNEGFIRASGMSEDVIGLNVANGGLLEVHRIAETGEQYTHTLQPPQQTPHRSPVVAAAARPRYKQRQRQRQRCEASWPLGQALCEESLPSLLLLPERWCGLGGGCDENMRCGGSSSGGSGERRADEDEEEGGGGGMCKCIAEALDGALSYFKAVGCKVIDPFGPTSPGKRSVVEEAAAACVCNASYVSAGCCWAGEDGLVWEAAERKMGQLAEEGLLRR